MKRPKTCKCPTCGYGICSACRLHRMPNQAQSTNQIIAATKEKHGEPVKWCRCMGAA